MTEYKIAIEDSPSPEEMRIVHQGLGDYNEAQVGDGHYKKLTIFLRDGAGTVVGGLLGATYWDWLHVETLWIEEAYRGKGCGAELMAAAETEALRRNCKSAFLDSMSFQARPFYEGLGYTLFGVLDHYPGEHRRFFLQKTLLPEAGEVDSRKPKRKETRS